jgi:hypothetical protein
VLPDHRKVRFRVPICILGHVWVYIVMSDLEPTCYRKENPMPLWLAMRGLTCCKREVRHLIHAISTQAEVKYDKDLHIIVPGCSRMQQLAT